MLKYSYRHFGTENGLTQNSVEHALFDKNGYLWISIRTDNVFVYDGYRFTPCWFYDNGKRHAFKSASLFCSSTGDIFIAHESGMHVLRQNSGAFIQISKSVTSRENEEIRFIGEGNRNQIYFYSYRGGMVYILQKSASGAYSIEASPIEGNTSIIFENNVDPVAKKSFFWFTKQNETGFYLFDIAQKRVIKKIAQPEQVVIMTRFAVDSSLYGLDNNSVLYKADTHGWQAVAALNKFFAHDEQWQSVTFTNKSTGEVFIGSGQHLYKFNYDFTSPPSIITNAAGKSVLSRGGVTKILQRDAAHLWFFTSSEGIYQLDIKPKKFEHFKTDEGSLNFVRSIYKDESTGNVFSGLFYGGLVIYDADGKIIKKLPMPGMIGRNKSGFCVNSISKLANNMYLVWYNAGRAYLLNTLDWTMKSIINSGSNWEENNNGIIIDYSGFLQMGKSRFATGYKNRIYFFDVYANGIQITDSIVYPLYRPEAFYYSAPYFYFGGIGSFYRWHAITKKIDSFPLPLTTKVKWISCDRYNRLWISTETGINILQNDKPNGYKVVKILTTDDGLPNHYIYVAEPDNKGKMWCSSNKGIFSIDINNYSVTSYSTVDGLQSEEFNTGSFYRDNTGNFYYGGVNGLNFFNPALMKESGEASAAHINFIGSGDSVLYQYPNSLFPASINLSYKNAALRLRFSALNYNTQGFNQYEYRLHASDSFWTDNGSNNELQVLLSPGAYDIEVRLKNAPLSAARLLVLVQPPFYQTIWFALLAIAAMAAIFALLINRRIKNKYRKKIVLLEMQQKIQGERERISRDLHDDIGAKANMLAYNVSLLNKTISEEELKQVKMRMKGTSEDMMQSLRETVWTLKQENITAEDVWTRFKNFIAKLQQTYSPVQFTIEEDEPSSKKINYNEALNLIRILQEALNNAIKHSGCKVIWCSRFTAGQAVVFRVKDDGLGFNVAESDKLLNEGNGLQNMEQRAQESGFEFSIFTAQNKGTTITIKI